MRAKLRLLSSFLLLLVVLGVTAGCNKSRSDAQVASDVQSKINSDAAIASKTIAVQAGNGVVTLSGNVATDNERLAAANDAAGIAGVKTVVNNLQVGAEQTAQQQAPAPAPAAQEPPTPAEQPAAPPEKKASREKPSARERRHRAAGMSDAQIHQDLASSEAPSQNQSAPATAPVQNTPPPPPPKPAKVTIPAGTSLSVRLLDGLDSERNQVGDTFRATLNSPVVIDDDVVLPRDADVQGRVVDVKSAGRFAGGSNLTIELTSLSVNGRTYNIQTNQWAKNGTGQGKKTAAKTIGGSALGAIIGGIAGGGKGAAIGTIAGAGAGGATAAATNKANQIKLGPEALLSFSLQNPLTVTPQASSDRNAGRQPLNQ